jgi:hypothetical protein
MAQGEWQPQDPMPHRRAAGDQISIDRPAARCAAWLGCHAALPALTNRGRKPGPSACVVPMLRRHLFNLIHIEISSS